MKRNWKRLVWAACLSLFCYLATHIWYVQSQTKNNNFSSSEPIAFAIDLNNEVLRRPVARTIWQSLGEGEPLYPGEAIRTGDRGDVRIQFSDSNKFIDVEPESLIVITQNSNQEISLDLLDGGLFVGSQNAAQKSSDLTLTLKSNDGKKVDLTNATAQLTKTESSEVSLQVLQGEASVKTKDGASTSLTETDRNAKFDIIKPKLGEPVYINPESPEPIEFEWSSQSADSQVQLMWGKSRKELRPVALSEFGSNTIKYKSPPGKYFWKLHELNRSKKVISESNIFRIEANARYAPALVFPLEKQNVEISSSYKELELRWSKPNDAEKVLVQVYSFKNPNEPIFEKSFSDQQNVRIPISEGNYFWKASAIYKGQSNSLSSPRVQFGVSSQFKAAKPPVTVSWSNDIKNTQYFIDQPLADLSWASPEKDQVRQWKITIQPEDETDGEPVIKIVEAKQTQLKAPLTKPGRYIASVEAIGDNNLNLASSEKRAIEIQVLPLLDAPYFLPKQGDLQADSLGNIELTWENKPEAKEYEVVLINREGKQIKKGRFKGSSTKLVNLFPGQYQVQIRAIDKYGRLGEAGELRAVQVPEKSGVEAPKLRKIKVN